MPLEIERFDEYSTQPYDDASICNNSFLIRHINPEFHLTYDENIGTRRISSGAFSATSHDPNFGMSVDIEQLLRAAGEPENKMVPDGFGAVRLNVGDIRNINLKVGHDPTPTNSFHGQVWGVRNKIRSNLHKIASDWVVEIAGVRIR